MNRVKLIFSIMVLIAIIPVLFFLLLVAAFSGKFDFYGPFLISFAIGFYIFAVIGIYGGFRKKAVPKVFAAFLLLYAAVWGGYEGYHKYLDNITIVTEQDVDLRQYAPFAEGSMAARLDEPSAFVIRDDNLPFLDGSTALYPLYAAFAQAVYPAGEYPVYNSEVMSSQTSGAYERLIEGLADIIFVPEPSESHLQMARERNVELRLTPVAREAFIFFVNEGNPVEGLTSEQLRSIYSGSIRNWKEVGGQNRKIIAFQRPDNSGSQQALKRFMGDVPIEEPPRERVMRGMGMMIKETARYKNFNNALGFSFRFFTEEMVQNGTIRNLAVDGVYPSKENIRNGSYPLTVQFYAVTAGSDNPHVQPFLEWILSEQGQSLVEKTGYVPIVP